MTDCTERNVPYLLKVMVEAAFFPCIDLTGESSWSPNHHCYFIGFRAGGKISFLFYVCKKVGASSAISALADFPLVLINFVSPINNSPNNRFQCALSFRAKLASTQNGGELGLRFWGQNHFSMNTICCLFGVTRLERKSFKDTDWPSSCL